MPLLNKSVSLLRAQEQKKLELLAAPAAGSPVAASSEASVSPTSGGMSLSGLAGVHNTYSGLASPSAAADKGDAKVEHKSVS